MCASLENEKHNKTFYWNPTNHRSWILYLNKKSANNLKALNPKTCLVIESLQWTCIKEKRKSGVSKESTQHKKHLIEAQTLKLWILYLNWKY